MSNQATRPTVVIDREAAREMMQELKRLVEGDREKDEGRASRESPHLMSGAVYSLTDALGLLFGLPDELLSFVAACAQDPTDHVTLQVFADWLEDRQRPEEAEAVRRLTPQSGDVLVMTYPRGGHEEVEREALMRAGEQLRKHLAGLGRDVFVAVLPNDRNLYALSDADLGTLGLGRMERMHELVGKETEALRKEVERLKRQVGSLQRSPRWSEPVLDSF